MTIKEGIERTLPSVQERAYRFIDKEKEISSSYKKKVLEAGRSILRESGASGLVQDLVEQYIKPNFQDVNTVEMLTEDGSTHLSIEWNFRDRLIPPGEISSFTYKYNAVSITAYPLTADLVVRGGEDLEILGKSQWSSDPKLLEDAIVRAYQVPMQMMGPPVRA